MAAQVTPPPPEARSYRSTVTYKHSFPPLFPIVTASPRQRVGPWSRSSQLQVRETLLSQVIDILETQQALGPSAGSYLYQVAPILALLP